MATRLRIEKNIQAIQAKIALACAARERSTQNVRIVAVTKLVGLEDIKSLVDLGVTDLAESRVPQLMERSAELAAAMGRRRNGAVPPVRWHMVGHLQRNKVKAVLEAGVDIIHSVDTLRLAEEISQRAQKADKVVEVLLEVNCSEEAQKLGVAVGAAAYLSEMVATLKNVRLVGLMTMAAQDPDPERARPTFVRLREIFEEIRHERHVGEHFQHLSMGMSQDYWVAVEEGATMLRVGTALFA